MPTFTLQKNDKFRLKNNVESVFDCVCSPFIVMTMHGNIFSIPYNTHCNLVHLIAQDSSVRVELHKRYFKFFNNASKSNNTLVSMMSRLVINGSGSAACRSVNFICSTYDLNKYDISLSLLSKLKDNDEECES